MYNNAFVLDKLGEQPKRTPHRGPTPRKRVRSSPCLPQRLPSRGVQIADSRSPSSHSRFPHVGVLERDAQEEIPWLMIRQLRHSPSPPPESASEETISEPTTPTSPTTPRSPILGRNPFSRKPKPAPLGGKLWTGSEPQVCIPAK